MILDLNGNGRKTTSESFRDNKLFVLFTNIIARACIVTLKGFLALKKSLPLGKSQPIIFSQYSSYFPMYSRTKPLTELIMGAKVKALLYIYIYISKTEIVNPI